jgi:type III pantothenate kinase
MYLTIDIGNTRMKAAVYSAEGHLLEEIATSDNSLTSLQSLKSRHQPQHAIVSTTGEKNWSVNDLDVRGQKIELSHQTKMPVKLVYKTPETLGRDRIASACGAFAKFPGQTCLVISAGTCMTLDVVLDTGIFIGGNIAPGLQMRLQSMHAYTAKLPLAEPGWPELEFGDSTIHALQNGACLGMIMEIEGTFQRAKNAFGEVTIVMTGGDAAFLAGHLESQIFVAPDLVTHGLYKILAFNV